jgi:mono/diheme cytochrome c family protein
MRVDAVAGRRRRTPPPLDVPRRVAREGRRGRIWNADINNRRTTMRPLTIMLATAWVWVAASPLFAQPAPATDAAPNLKNGEYLFWAGGCASCHAAPATDRCDNNRSKEDLQLVGGRCLKTEFGTFYVPNITPDKETGIGGWSTDDFINAMTKGVAPDGTNLYPSFPYASYQRMTRADLIDLKAYLDTLPAVASKVSEHELSFPYSVRATLSVWKGLYLDGKTFEPDPGKSGQVNRGAYLVNGPGHCGECHTPRDRLGGMIRDKWLSGAPNPEGKGIVPNLTPHESGLAKWSEKDIAYALETGITPSGDAMGGHMRKVQENMAKLTKEDREAIAAYLKSLPPVESPKKD